MHKRIAIGLFVLIFILGVAIVFYHQYTDIQQLKKEAAEAEKLIEGNEKPVAENNLPPAPSGYKWVPHGDHHHLVPIDAPDTWQEGTHQKPVQPSQQIVSQQENRTSRERPKYTGERTYEAYEKYVTEAFQNIKRNEFGLPISPLPAAPPAFRNQEEEGKADRLWNKLAAEYDKSVIAAAIRMDARYVAPEYTGELTYDAYHKYLAERKKLKEANNE
ncbi:MAG: hypothetical protein OXI67_09990 [Candidatus Poribacteria bacterium]|nr:hypothetical protein [Candidatus Poribacteria bacterium]